MSARSDRSEPTLRDKIRKFMLETYLDWAESEGVPIYEDFAIDMLSIETMNGVVIHAVTGKGYSFLWYQGEKYFHRTDWQHGVIYSPPDEMFHHNVACVDFAALFGRLQRIPTT